MYMPDRLEKPGPSLYMSYLPECVLVRSGSIHALQQRLAINAIGESAKAKRHEVVSKNILNRFSIHRAAIDVLPEENIIYKNIKCGSLTFKIDDVNADLYDENGEIPELVEAPRLKIDFYGASGPKEVVEDFRRMADFIQDNASDDYIRDAYIVGYTHPRMAHLATRAGMKTCRFSLDSYDAQIVALEAQAYNEAIAKVNKKQPPEYYPAAVYIAVKDFLNLYSTAE